MAEGSDSIDGVLNTSLSLFEIISVAAVHGFEVLSETDRESDTPFMSFFRANLKGMPPTPLLAIFNIAGREGTASKFTFNL